MAGRAERPGGWGNETFEPNHQPICGEIGQQPEMGTCSGWPHLRKNIEESDADRRNMPTTEINTRRFLRIISIAYQRPTAGMTDADVVTARLGFCTSPSRVCRDDAVTT